MKPRIGSWPHGTTGAQSAPRLATTIKVLRDALARKPGRPMREPGSPLRLREDTKLTAVQAMLRLPEDATAAQADEATG